MCMFEMKQKVKKNKRTPEEEANAVKALNKKFAESESGRSLAKWIGYLTSH